MFRIYWGVRTSKKLPIGRWSAGRTWTLFGHRRYRGRRRGGRR